MTGSSSENFFSVSPVDLDEYFATSKTPPTFRGIVSDGKLDGVIARSSYTDPKWNYTDRLDPETGVPVLRTSHISQRDSFVFPVQIRTKYVARGRHVDEPRIHFVKSFKSEVAVSYPDPAITVVLHYRSAGETTKVSVADARGQVHRHNMEIRVAKAWKEITHLNRELFLDSRNMNSSNTTGVWLVLTGWKILKVNKSAQLPLQRQRDGDSLFLLENIASRITGSF